MFFDFIVFVGQVNNLEKFKVVGFVDWVLYLVGVCVGFQIGGFGIGILKNVQNKDVVFFLMQWLIFKKVDKLIVMVGGNLLCYFIYVDEDVNEKFLYMIIFGEVFKNVDFDWCLIILVWGKINVDLGIILFKIIVEDVLVQEFLDVIVECVQVLMQDVGYYIWI